MDKKNNKFIAVNYRLYVDGDNGKELMEETKADQPFQFITGFGIALDAFEHQVEGLEKGTDFNFTLEKEEAYGEYVEERVLDLDREMFCVDGRFDREHIYVDAIIPLQNEDGNHFYGRVVEIGDQQVKVDLNHPLAGETLHFEGTILENREATEQEIQHLIKHLSGGCGGCGGGCHGDCEGGCDGCHIGNIFRLTTFGESHGEAIGGVVDGMPAGIPIDMAFIQQELNRRRPGQSHITTARQEADQIELLSGVFEGKTTG